VFRDALGGRHRARLEEHCEAVIMVAVNLEAGVHEEGATGAEILFIGELVIVGMYRIE
jgi:hypothetical protein